MKLEVDYQRNVPGSRLAASYLEGLANSCRNKIIELLRIESDRDKISIEFYSGTSRAIEVSITRAPKPLKVIISPYEHPSEVKVIDWLVTHLGIEKVSLSISIDCFERNWDTIEKEIETQLREIVKDGSRNYLFVVSEVSYFTGMIVPVKRIMDKFRRVNGVNLLFLIDASHSVGNFKECFGGGNLTLEKNDSYIFGSHKWLLAAEPCGVLILNSEGSELSNSLYDSWSHNLPETTVGVLKIANFLSSLEFFLEGNRYDTLLVLSKKMKKYFIESVSDKFHVIGYLSRQEQSNLIAIKPKDGYVWKESTRESLTHFFAKNGVNCLVLDKDPRVFWLRLTFLYFITYSENKRLKKILEKSIAVAEDFGV